MLINHRTSVAERTRIKARNQTLSCEKLSFGIFRISRLLLHSIWFHTQVFPGWRTFHNSLACFLLSLCAHSTQPSILRLTSALLFVELSWKCRVSEQMEYLNSIKLCWCWNRTSETSDETKWKAKKSHLNIPITNQHRHHFEFYVLLGFAALLRFFIFTLCYTLNLHFSHPNCLPSLQPRESKLSSLTTSSAVRNQIHLELFFNCDDSCSMWEIKKLLCSIRKFVMALIVFRINTSSISLCFSYPIINFRWVNIAIRHHFSSQKSDLNFGTYSCRAQEWHWGCEREWVNKCCRNE